MRRIRRAFLAATGLALCAMTFDAGAAIKSEGISPLLPPQGPIEEPLVERVRWPWFVAAGCLVVSAILLWPRQKRVIPSEPPATRARRQLRELRPLNPVTLGAILREYVIATHAVPGPGQTFDELAIVLAGDPRWTPSLRERFRKIADPLEIAKFAPGESAANLEALRDEALAVVEEADALHRPPVPTAR